MASFNASCASSEETFCDVTGWAACTSGDRISSIPGFVKGRWAISREEWRRDNPRSGWAAGTRPDEIRIGMRFVVSCVAFSGSRVPNEIRNAVGCGVGRSTY